MFAFSFKGRASRAYFWWMGIMLPLALFAVKEWLIFKQVGVSTVRFENAAIFLMDGFLTLFCLWLQVAATVKRLHDMGHSSWFQFVYIMPALLGCIGFLISNKFGLVTAGAGFTLSILWIIVHCGFFSGDPEKNIYGEPLE